MGGCNNVFHRESSKTHVSKAVRLHKLPEKEGGKKSKNLLDSSHLVKYEVRQNEIKLGMK